MNYKVGDKVFYKKYIGTSLHEIIEIVEIYNDEYYVKGKTTNSKGDIIDIFSKDGCNDNDITSLSMYRKQKLEKINENIR